MKSIDSLEAVQDSTYFIFKHSATCPISAAADKAVNQAEGEIGLPIYKVVIQKNRQLSTEIARQFNVVHESPQLILIKDGSAAWDESHYGITKDTIISVAERHS